MEKKFVGSNKSVANPTGLVANLTAHGPFQGYPALTTLHENLERHEKKYPLLDRDELEMLEAELQNQGLVRAPRDARFRLSFRLAFECSAFAWRARCYGAERVGLSFKVNLPRFIVECAVRAALENAVLSSADDRELEYLEQFADYVLGKQRQATNRYFQGMNLVLQVLARPKKPRHVPGKKTVEVVLPATKFEFLRLIAPYRVRRTSQYRAPYRSWK